MRFLYADGRMPVAMEKGGATYYFSYDQVGSLRVVADGSGNVVKRIDYDSFGNIINDTNASFQIPFGFAGGLHDRDIGLVRFGFRDYDPDIGRWTAKDPTGFNGGDVDLYGYCLNDPINWVDPRGLVYLVPDSPHDVGPNYGRPRKDGYLDPGHPIDPRDDPYQWKYPPEPPMHDQGLVPSRDRLVSPYVQREIMRQYYERKQRTQDTPCPTPAPSRDVRSRSSSEEPFFIPF